MNRLHPLRTNPFRARKTPSSTPPPRRPIIRVVLSSFHPLVSDWFAATFGAPTQPQLLGWPEIRQGRDVLISAPTGSGKTLAAFLSCIDSLIARAQHGSQLGPLPDQTEVLYVSPLKALSNDVHKNLDIPLAGIASLAAARGVPLAPIRAALRTGDTPQWERQQLTRRRPHILVTTPESLYILLTAARPREMLRTVRTVIVDEIHAIADDKRGSHLALSLARLDRLVEQTGAARPQRIGLSATVKPIEEVAAFLSDSARIVNVGHRRAMDLAIEIPQDELGVVASNEMWGEIYDRTAALIRENRTTLVFVNTRRLSERVTHHLAERLGENAVLPHHGSLSRALRLEAERRLKAGELRAVVATASLELGIDIGAVDLVCQIGSPRSIAVALQRIGRAGHWVGALPKGRLFATTRDELIECAALVRAIRRGQLDRLEIPRNALDILAQQMVASCAAEEFGEDELFDLVRRAWPYRTLSRVDFDAVLGMLSDGIATSRGRSGAWLHRDAVNRRVRGRRGARLTAITSGGAIPDSAQYLVVAEPEGKTVGSVDEDFAVESLAGDVFLLGTTSWRIRRVEAGRVRVEDAHGAAPNIPFWRGEAPGRTRELSGEFSDLREEIARSGVCPPECGLPEAAARQAVAYVLAGNAALGAAPTTRRVVAERFFDEGGGMQLVIHAPFGARINRAWGLALRKRFCRSFNFELQAAATDNGIVLSLGEQHSFPLEIVFEFLRPATVEHVLTQAVLPAPMFVARWRWNASRALAIPRYSGGRKVPPPIQRMKADDLMAAVFPDQAACPENLTGEPRVPDHPLVKETIENCLYEAMDLTGLRQLLADIHDGAIRTLAIDTPEPSPFSHEILNANPYAFLDDAPLEERRTRAVQMRRTLPADYAEGASALDPAAIAQVASEAWPPMRDADELHEALCGLGLLECPQECDAQLAVNAALLMAARRATTFTIDGRRFWVASERLDLVRRVYPQAAVDPPVAVPPAARAIPESLEACAAEILRGWFECSGPLRAADLSRKLAMPRDLMDQALAQLEAEGQILRGQFTGGGISGPPSVVPFDAPAVALTGALTRALAGPPSASPPSAPAGAPSDVPAHVPSGVPYGIPAGASALVSNRDRSAAPAGTPAGAPCGVPAYVPSSVPCEIPAGASAVVPNRDRSAAPAGTPAGASSAVPPYAPSSVPCGIPAGASAVVPNRDRSAAPAGTPVGAPCGVPASPSGVPHGIPAGASAVVPNRDRSAAPAGTPDGAPCGVPAYVPSGVPYGIPAGASAGMPTGDPPARPSGAPAASADVEWCHRRLLARIHRLTIGRLRREIEPVSTAAFFAFLHRWQHLAPGSQLHGVDGTLQIVRQLQGCEFPAAAWESEVLPRRVAQYQPDYLDQLCLAGEVSWGRLSPHPAFDRDGAESDEGAHRRSPRPTRVAPLAMFLREDAAWLLAVPQGPKGAPPRESLSHPAREVLAALETRGASFFIDLTRATGRLASEVEDALWELVVAGLATADGFENLRALLDPKRRAGQGKGRLARPRHAPGRWSLLRHTEGLPERHNESQPEDHAAAFARQLLARWGVLFRDAVRREPLAPPWRDLLVELRRMESRGEIRGGRFLDAYVGEQFALPEALDLLRSIRRTGETAAVPEGPGPWTALAPPLAPEMAAAQPAGSAP